MPSDSGPSSSSTLLSVSAVLSAASGPWPSHPPALPEDVGSIDAIVRAVYASVSFTDGRGPDAERLASLCVPHARLMKVHPGGIDDMSVPEFVDRVRTRIDAQRLTTFVERELFRRTEVFAGIAHVFTTYESRTDDGDGQLLYRGINSVQLRNDGRRWWILTILWTDERDECPIPPAYLPRA